MFNFVDAMNLFPGCGGLKKIGLMFNVAHKKIDCEVMRDIKTFEDSLIYKDELIKYCIYDCLCL